MQCNFLDLSGVSCILKASHVSERNKKVRASQLEEDEIMARRTCTVEDMAKVIGCGRTQAYKMVKAGEIRSIKVGNRYHVPTDAVRELLEKGTSAA